MAQENPKNYTWGHWNKLYVPQGMHFDNLGQKSLAVAANEQVVLLGASADEVAKIRDGSERHTALAFAYETADHSRMDVGVLPPDTKLAEIMNDEERLNALYARIGDTAMHGVLGVAALKFERNGDYKASLFLPVETKIVGGPQALGAMNPNIPLL